MVSFLTAWNEYWIETKKKSVKFVCLNEKSRKRNLKSTKGKNKWTQ